MAQQEENCQSRSLLNQALEMAIGNVPIELETLLKFALGRIHLEEGNTTTAFEMLKQAGQSAETSKNPILAAILKVFQNRLVSKSISFRY